MPTPHLDIAITRYDNTRALFDGSVTFDGLDATLHSPAIPEIFAGLASGRFDVAEFGLTHYLRALDASTDLVAIPVFPTRSRLRPGCGRPTTPASATSSMRRWPPTASAGTTTAA